MEALRQVEAWPVGHVAVAAVDTRGDEASQGELDRSFRWASVTKLATAVAVLVAAEEGIVERALAELGASLDDVVRTRIYVVDAAHIDAVGRAHREAFGTARPATTGVVTALLDPRWLVEIEAEAAIVEERP